MPFFHSQLKKSNGSSQKRNEAIICQVVLIPLTAMAIALDLT